MRGCPIPRGPSRVRQQQLAAVDASQRGLVRKGTCAMMDSLALSTRAWKTASGAPGTYKGTLSCQSEGQR